ncbi:hypothetical protein RZS08_64475, partial [Arthrospira platensis SPKY1]|nr:hypothetical protein [Arthrospira platensis SPKY1]
MRNEWQGGDLCRARLAANEEVDLRAGCGMGHVDVSHGHRAIDTRPETAGGDGADGIVAEEYFRAFPRRGAFQRADADTP